MGMMDKIKGLSTGAKAGIIGGAVLVAAAGVGLGVTQPWNQPEQNVVEPPPVQDVGPTEPARTEEKKLSVRAGNEVVDCVLYEGDGWSIYVPEGWSAEEAGQNGGRFAAEDGAELTVDFLSGSYEGSFVNLSPGEKTETLQFYTDMGSRSPSVTGMGPESKWDYYSKLFTALARTLTVSQNTPFGEVYIIPQLPDWQKAEGKTVLFLDKDGYVVDDKMQDVVESYMKSWSDEVRSAYTGQYRVNDIQWAGTYTGITENGYVDVFRASVQYRVAQDGEEALQQSDGGVKIVDGWASDGNSMFLVLFHDGGSVAKTQGITAADVQDWITFATLLK